MGDGFGELIYQAYKNIHLSVLEALCLSQIIFDKFFVHFDHENGLCPHKFVFIEFVLIYSQFSVILQTLNFSGRSRKNVKHSLF